MVREKIALTMVGLVLTIVNFTKVFAQPVKGYGNLERYRKWSLVAGPVLYNKAVLDPQYGNYTFENKPILSYSAGLEYDFFPAKKWSLITGGFITLEPIYNVELSIKKEDLYSNYNDDLTISDKSYAMQSFSIPILVRYRTEVAGNLFVNVLAGVKFMYFPYGGSYTDIIVHNEDDTEIREVFGLRVESSENPLYGSFVMGMGTSYAFKRILLSANLVYVVNFKNLIEGEYLFDNMFVSPRSYGYYKLSGNYLGLLLSVTLPKGKRKDLENSID